MNVRGYVPLDSFKGVLTVLLVPSLDLKSELTPLENIQVCLVVASKRSKS